MSTIDEVLKERAGALAAINKHYERMAIFAKLVDAAKELLAIDAPDETFSKVYIESKEASPTIEELMERAAQPARKRETKMAYQVLFVNTIAGQGWPRVAGSDNTFATFEEAEKARDENNNEAADGVKYILMRIQVDAETQLPASL
jgi:hypothetical protein